LSLSCKAIRRLCLPYLFSTVKINKINAAHSEHVRNLIAGTSDLTSFVR
jgi:hypothetical protein